MKRLAAAALLAGLACLAGAARAQVPMCPDEGGGGRVVPSTCRIASARALVLLAQTKDAALCAASGRTAALRGRCGGAGAGESCAPDALRAAGDAAAAWDSAAAVVWAAWDGHPLAHVDVLAAARDARHAEAALRSACGAPPPPVPHVPDPSLPRRGAYVDLVLGATTPEAVCAQRVALVGDAWSAESARYSPVAAAVSSACGPAPYVGRPAPAVMRARDVALALFARVAALGEPLAVSAPPPDDPRSSAAACGLLAAHVTPTTHDTAATACPRARLAWLTSVAVVDAPASAADCGGDTAARAACLLSVATAHGPLSAAALGGTGAALQLVARGAARATAHTTVSPIDGPYALTSTSTTSARCAAVVGTAERLLGDDASTLDETGARLLLFFSRCHRADADARLHEEAVRALLAVREAGVRSAPLDASPAHDEVTFAAGVWLVLVPGAQDEGRDVVAALARDGAAPGLIARAVAGGGTPDEEARLVAATTTTAALARYADVAIERGQLREASDALFAGASVRATAPLSAGERRRADLDDALLRTRIAQARGRRGAAAGALLAARALLDEDRASGRADPIYAAEADALEVELGLRDARIPRADDGCSRDLLRRDVLRRLSTARGTDELRPLLDALRDDAARPLVDRGVCLVRGYRGAEILAAVAHAELVVACLDAASDEHRPSTACAASPHDAVVEVGHALRDGAAAAARWEEYLALTGDVDRTGPLEASVDALRSAAERLVEERSVAQWRAAGATERDVVLLRNTVVALDGCLVYPELAVNLRWLVHRPVPTCAGFGALTPGATTVVYVHYESARGPRYAAWVGTTPAMRRVDLGPAASVDREVAALVRDLSDASAPPVSSARAVYDAVLAPLGLPEAGDVVVVPDGALAGVPFDALDDGHGWLAREGGTRFRYALSPGALAPGALMRGAAAVVVADVRFGPADGAGGIPRLRATHAEADSLCAHFDCGDRRLEREAATEPAVFAAVQERAGVLGVLHLATHAVFRGRGGDARANVVLAGVGDDLPSGAAWSSSEDGLLDDRELASLGLTQTGLVVLSACETEAGASRSGIRGLARAARVAGAHAVVGSLWSVDDAATGALMAGFYDRAAQGATLSVALRDARARVRETMPHPYYWAPFVLLEAP